MCSGGDKEIFLHANIKAENLYVQKIHEIFLSRNCRRPKFAKFSCYTVPGKERTCSNLTVYPWVPRPLISLFPLRYDLIDIVAAHPQCRFSNVS